LLSSLASVVLTLVFSFLFHATSPTAIYTLSLHDALPICSVHVAPASCDSCTFPSSVPTHKIFASSGDSARFEISLMLSPSLRERDRKSTRLNSSHRTISYAVFCLKKKKKNRIKKRRSSHK